MYLFIFLLLVLSFTLSSCELNPKPTPAPKATEQPTFSNESAATPTPTSESTPRSSSPNNESLIVGRWQSRSNHTAPISGNYEMITTVIFHLDGTYEYSVINTLDPKLGIQTSGQWKKTDENTIFANVQDPNSGKVYEHKYRIIDQDTIINSYGETSIRLP